MAKIIQEEKSAEGRSYRIDFGGGMVLWFDVWVNASGEIIGDWNKYIFHTDDARDMEIKAFQEAHNDEAGAYNFAEAFEVASDAFEDAECNYVSDDSNECITHNVEH